MNDLRLRIRIPVPDDAQPQQLPTARGSTQPPKQPILPKIPNISDESILHLPYSPAFSRSLNFSNSSIAFFPPGP